MVRIQNIMGKLPCLRSEKNEWLIGKVITWMI